MPITRTSNITFFHREVHNPILRALTVVFIIALFLVFLPVLLYILVVSVPFHFLLRLFGGRGFTRWEGNSVRYNVPLWFAIPAVLVLLALIFL